MDPVLLLSAFVAGLVMFLAPCTLPLLPAYLSFISGVTALELEDERAQRVAKRRILKNGIGFVLGFSFVFVVFGVLAGSLGSVIGPYREYLNVVAAVLVIVFGLFMLGLLEWSVLTKQRRIQTPRWLTVGTPTSSLVLGGAFAFGWTPCIGPILATVLFLAGSTETAVSGAILLVVFSVGFSIPFLLLAALISNATQFVSALMPYLQTVSKVSGAILIILGLFMLFGDFASTTAWVFELLESLDYEATIMRYL